MRLLVDMGISPATAAFLRRIGHEAVHLYERNLGRLTDPDILALACEEDRIVLTSDLDFGDLLAYSGAGLPSVIILRLSDMRPESVNAYLEAVLQQFSDILVAGVILVVTHHRVRVRRLPIRRANET